MIEANGLLIPPRRGTGHYFWLPVPCCHELTVECTQCAGLREIMVAGARLKVRCSCAVCFVRRKLTHALHPLFIAGVLRGGELGKNTIISQIRGEAKTEPEKTKN